MAIHLHNLKANKKATRKKRRRGRGNASGRGNYSGRGMKGQRSRSGGKKGLKLKGFKRSLLVLPKFKGNKSIKPNNQVIGLDILSEKFKDSDTITPEILYKKGLTNTMSAPVKILGNGEIKLKLEIKDCLVSTSAKAAIEKAGGKVYDMKKAEGRMTNDQVKERMKKKEEGKSKQSAKKQEKTSKQVSKKTEKPKAKK